MVTLGSLLFLAFLGFLFFGVPLLYQEHHDTPETPQPQPPATPRTAKETLAMAREMLSSGDAAKASDLLRPLAADPRYGPEARRLLKRVTSQIADELAAGMQKSMFDAGEEVYVKAIGQEKDTIQFSGPLIDALWVHQFTSGELPRKLQRMGFKRVLFSNSVTGEGWSQKLD